MTGCIIGWAHTPFGRHAAETVESLIVQVATAALADASVSASDVDEIFLGHFNGGFSAQDFTAALVLQASTDFRFKPATRVENACATGSAAVHQGLQAIAAKQARIAGGRCRTDDNNAWPAGRRNCSRRPMCARRRTSRLGLLGIFGQIAARYFQKYGDQSDALAMIAAKNHRNGVGNPYAQLRKDLGYDFAGPKAIRIRS